jgi:hypothetical protein
MGEHECLDVPDPILDRSKVGQDQVHTRLGVLREEDAAIDHEESTVVLEDGHVAADLADAAKGDDSERALGQRRW